MKINTNTKEERTMKKSTIAKWVIASVAVTAVAAFVAGVAFELRAIRKLTVDIDNEEEPQADDLTEEEIVAEMVADTVEDVIAEA